MLVGGDVGLQNALSANKGSVDRQSAIVGEDSASTSETVGFGTAKLGLELDMASLKEMIIDSAARQEAIVAQQAAETSRRAGFSWSLTNSGAACKR